MIYRFQTTQNMCLAIPGKLIEITTDPAGVKMGRANFGGIVKQVCLEYTPEAEAGDYILVHVGFALSKVDENEAARTYQLLDEMKQLGELDTPEVSDDGLAEWRGPAPQSSSWSGSGGREEPGEGPRGIRSAEAQT